MILTYYAGFERGMYQIVCELDLTC